MQLNASASAKCSELPIKTSGHQEFNARITSWLKTVEPATPSPESTGRVCRTVRNGKTLRQSSKPYARPTQQELHLSHGSSNTDESPVSAFPLPGGQRILELRNASRIDRSLRTLPHPIDNPLITHCPEDLQEEYARVVLLYNAVEEKKRPIERRWLQRPSMTTLRELDNLELSSQQIISAAQYIVDFAYSLRIDIDFKTIFLRYRSTPQPHKKSIDNTPSQMKGVLTADREYFRDQNTPPTTVDSQAT